MSAHRSNTDLYKALTGAAVIDDPGTGNTVDLRGMHFGVARNFGAGTYKLPNVDAEYEGCMVIIVASGTETWQNAAGTTRGVLQAGETALAVASTTSDWTMTLLPAGLAVEINTAADVPIADAGSYTTATQLEDASQMLLRHALHVSTGISTVGAGTLTAAAMVGGIINRSGSTAAYTDTTATAAQIVAALDDGVSAAAVLEGYTWLLYIRNTVAFAQTISGGTGVTVSGTTVVPPNSIGIYLMKVVAPGSGAEDVSMVGFGSWTQGNLQEAKFTTIATDTTITAAAGALTGARYVVYQTTAAGAGGIALTTRTATEMFGDTPNAYIGLSYVLKIVSQGGGTVTVTAGAGVTITGTATVATKTTRTFIATFTSATALTLQGVDKGTIE